MEVETKGKDLNSEADKTGDSGELKLGGNIKLAGFSLEPVEMIVVKKIIGNYAKKIGEKTSYKEIKLTLKQTQKAKSFLHEIRINVQTNGKQFTGEAVENNLYTALSEALEKVYNQAEHQERTARQESR